MQVHQEVDAIRDGMAVIRSEPSFRTFDVEELDLLLNGQNEVDIDHIRAYAVYQGAYSPKHVVVLWLWQCLNEFTNETRQQFLRFVTG